MIYNLEGHGDTEPVVLRGELLAVSGRWGQRAVVALVAVAVLGVDAGCTASSLDHHAAPNATDSTVTGATKSRAASRGPWAALEARPLRIPHVGPRQRCPVTSTWTSPPTRRFARVYGARPILGDGPVFPLGPWPYPSAIEVAGNPARQPVRGSALKVLWAAVGYHGRVLIRGQQLDGHHPMLFHGSDGPDTDTRELRIAGHGRPLSYPSETILHSLGCYAWQVDGEGFSRVIVFEAVATNLDAGVHFPTVTTPRLAVVHFEGNNWYAKGHWHQGDAASVLSDGGTMTRLGPIRARFLSVGGQRLTFHL
jgi:hypothetical protein